MAICTLCTGQTSEIFRARDYRRPDDRNEYPAVWCASCAYGKVLWELDPAQVSSFYDVPYYTHGDSTASGPRRGLLDRLRVHLAWRLDRGVAFAPDELSGKRGDACDLGCGGGGLLDVLAKAGYQVIGVEPDPAARAVAGRFGEVLPGTVEALPPELDGRKFDVVMLSHVLEHCVDPMRALGNARELLAPDGSLIVEVPNNAAVGFEMFRACWPWTDIPRHLHFFTERSLQRALGAAGMKVERIYYVGYTRQFDMDWLSTQAVMQAQIGSRSTTGPSLAAWRLLLKTAFAADASKYDSIRVHARAI